MSDDEVTLTVAELADYCRTQAGLLSGRVETLGEEADALLKEIDEEIASVREGLSEAAPEGGAEELDALEEKQAVVEAKQARMAAFRELSAAYVDLAEEFDTRDDWRAALERVLEFERDHDAPVYFDDRETLLEAAAETPDDRNDGDAPDDRNDGEAPGDSSDGDPA